jgi:hypothetical protein
MYGERRLMGCIINKLNSPSEGIHLASRTSFWCLQ